MGVLTFYPDGEEPARYDLLATRSIAARQDAPPTLEEIERRVAESDDIFPPFSLSWVLPPLVGAGAVVAVILLIIRAIRKAHKGRGQLPTPKSRLYS